MCKSVQFLHTFGYVCAGFDLLLQFRIAQAGVIDGLELLNKNCFCICYITEGDRAVSKETISYLTVNQTFNKFAD